MMTPDQFLPFPYYFEHVFVPLQKLQLPIKALHRGTCEKLQSAFFGELKKSFLVINIPPRVGKTKMMEAFITWILAYFPDAQNIYTSYSNELAKTSVRYIQEVLNSTWYQDLFPTRVGAIRQADHFTTTVGGKVYGDGVGGSLTGLGAGLKRPAGGVIVLDDPTKPDEAQSKVESDKIRFWFENTLKSRRNSSQWTPIILCMQRIDPYDLSGFLLSEYPDEVEHVCFSALDEHGESTIPETVSTKTLMDTKRVNPFAFAAQYLQEPVVIGGNLIKTDNFDYYSALPKFELKVITVDTAMKAKDSNDDTVLQCWGRSQKRAFLVDQVWGKWDTEALLKNAAQFYRKHHTGVSPIAYMSVEEAANGTTLIAQLRKKGIPCRPVKMRIKDKVTRVKDILAYQATRMVLLPRDAKWVPAFLLQCAEFREDGKARHDDMVDCFSDGVLICLGKATSILQALGKQKNRAA